MFRISPQQMTLYSSRFWMPAKKSILWLVWWVKTTATAPYLLWLDGADLFLFTSASPGRGLGRQPALESARWVEDINRAYASLFTSFVVHTHRAGYEDGLNFWGGSTIYDPNGNVLAKAPYHEETLLISEIDLNQLHRTRARLPLLRDERTALTMRELQRILGEGQSS